MRRIKTRRRNNKPKTRKTVGKRPTNRKRKYTRKVRGGDLIPRGVKNMLTQVGLRNITNIEEIKDCNTINSQTVPRLFLVLQGMRNYNEDMYNYYMPLDSDSPESKQIKCDRLNALREEWIQRKNDEIKTGRTDTDMDRAIINKTFMGMNKDTTRYFHFLADKYCYVVEDDQEKPQICYTYTKAQLQEELGGQQ